MKQLQTRHKVIKAKEIILLIFFCILLTTDLPSNAEDRVSKLIHNLQNKHPHTRAQAVIEMGKIKDARVVAPLINALHDTDSYVRGQAARALGEIRDANAVLPLITTLNNDDYLYVRQESSKALGKIKDVRAVQPLINALKDESQEIRYEATKALLEIGTPATETLYRSLNEHNLRVVADAYYFFICVGGPNTETILIEALNKYGTKRMAIDFKNSENSQLKEAAYTWAGSHGYKIQERHGVNSPGWERCKS
jgi:HEAT repeat protein